MWSLIFMDNWNPASLTWSWFFVENWYPANKFMDKTFILTQVHWKCMNWLQYFSLYLFLTQHYITGIYYTKVLHQKFSQKLSVYNHFNCCVYWFWAREFCKHDNKMHGTICKHALELKIKLTTAVSTKCFYFNNCTCIKLSKE